MTLFPLGDAALVVSLGERADEAAVAQVRAVAAQIMAGHVAGVTDVVPAFASVAVFYEPAVAADYATMAAKVAELAGQVDATAARLEPRRVEIPVCYGGEFGPDLSLVAERAGVSPEQVRTLHRETEYWVQAIGFAPGFPYLGGLPPTLATPRRATPRTLVPAGSVAIGGAQTGIYPFATPGGWNIIGRTPSALFDANQTEPALLRMGDRVSWREVSQAEFALLARASGKPERTPNVDASGRGRIVTLKAGAMTTVQDLGRVGHRAAGVPASGAVDAMALRVANLVVGNAEGAAGLEFTLLGPTLRFERDAVVALSGGDFGLPRWRPLHVQAGEVLSCGAARSGCRGYLSVAGGIDVPQVLGSRSTYAKAGFGGAGGRALRDGDELQIAETPLASAGRWAVDPRILPAYASAPTVRVVPGRHTEEFSAEWLGREFKVTAKSDRMGVRLAGLALARDRVEELTSMPVAPGTIQVPPDGQPIVLLAEAQTIGGYPQVGHVVTVDLPLMGQVRRGDTVRFEMITRDEAHALILARERALGLLRAGVAQKLARRG